MLWNNGEHSARKGFLRRVRVLHLEVYGLPKRHEVWMKAGDPRVHVRSRIFREVTILGERLFIASDALNNCSSIQQLQNKASWTP